MILIFKFIFIAIVINCICVEISLIESKQQVNYTELDFI